MDAAKIFEGIALLIELAQRGEIDPWDVQVIEVIDRYLSELISAQEIKPGSREADLSQSGQAFLLASLLVLFKANTLSQLESPTDQQEPSVDELLLEDESEVGTRLRLPLEQQLHRRPAALPPPKRQVTLKELIDQLQLIATQLQSQDKLSNTAKRSRRLGTQSGTHATASSPLELAHQENLTQVAGELEQFLNLYSHQVLAQEHDWLNLEQLVEVWADGKQAALTASSAHQGKPALSNSECCLPLQRHERVSVFWALLLLSAQSKVELSQEEFYQEIKIRSISKAKNLAIADSDSKARVCSY
jgi:segregation and condensation protein A